MELKHRKDHCVFVQLNNAGRCIANCYYNLRYCYLQDCIGKTEGTNYEAGTEVQLKGRRVEYEITDEQPPEAVTTNRENSAYAGWKLKDFYKLRQGSSSP